MIGIVTFMAASVAGLIQAVTGFGAGIFMMLFFPVFFPILNASALSSSIALFLSTSLLWRYRKQCQWKLTILPSCFYIVSSSISMLLAPYLPTDMLKKIFGVFLLILSVYFLFVAGKFKIKASLFAAMICAGISGIASGIFGIGGPPMVIYFLAALDDKEEYLGTIQLFFTVTGAYNLVFRIINGIYTPDLVIYTGIGLAAVLTGKKIGVKIVDRINIETMKKIVYVFLGLAGITNLM